jgi:hypothetical protein
VSANIDTNDPPNDIIDKEDDDEDDDYSVSSFEVLTLYAVESVNDGYEASRGCCHSAFPCFHTRLPAEHT